MRATKKKKELADPITKQALISETNKLFADSNYTSNYSEMKINHFLSVVMAILTAICIASCLGFFAVLRRGYIAIGGETLLALPGGILAYKLFIKYLNE